MKGQLNCNGEKMKTNDTTEYKLPRMRTIPKAFEEIKRIDPNTCFTLRALRRMVNSGELPTVSVASKKLINLDLLLDRLSCYNDNAICAP